MFNDYLILHNYEKGLQTYDFDLPLKGVTPNAPSECKNESLRVDPVQSHSDRLHNLLECIEFWEPMIFTYKNPS
jgi:hypothetical protein